MQISLKTVKQREQRDAHYHLACAILLRHITVLESAVDGSEIGDDELCCRTCHRRIGRFEKRCPSCGRTGEPFQVLVDTVIFCESLLCLELCLFVDIGHDFYVDKAKFLFRKLDSDVQQGVLRAAQEWWMSIGEYHGTIS